MSRELCVGWPQGHVCIVIVRGGDIYCTGCRERRQEATARGIPDSGIVPIGIVLEDIEAPILLCKCGGDPEGPDHLHSLLHMEWAFAQRIERGFTSHSDGGKVAGTGRRKTPAKETE